MTMRTKYDSRLTVLCPAELPKAINAAAAAKLQRPPEYIRAAILARLQADGITIGVHDQPHHDAMSVRTFRD